MLILNCLDTKNKHSTILNSTNINKYITENLIQTDKLLQFNGLDCLVVLRLM